MDRLNVIVYGGCGLILLVCAGLVGLDVGTNEQADAKCKELGLIAIKDVYNNRFCVKAIGVNND